MRKELRFVIRGENSRDNRDFRVMHEVRERGSAALLAVSVHKYLVGLFAKYFMDSRLAQKSVLQRQ